MSAMWDESDWMFGQEDNGEYMDVLFCPPQDVEAEIAEWEAAQEQANACEDPRCRS